MDFGDILNKWEKRGAGIGVYNKDAELPRGKNFAGERRSRLLRKKPDAVIDLHGLTRDEAWSALEVFFENSRRNGFEKILVIHGKGNHQTQSPRGESRSFSAYALADSAGGEESALKELSRKFIENCPFAGESGYSSAREGGSGASWVILKER